MAIPEERRIPRLRTILIVANSMIKKGIKAMPIPTMMINKSGVELATHTPLIIEIIAEIVNAGVAFVAFAGAFIFSGTTFNVEAPADQSPIQLGTLSPVASHGLFCSLGGIGI